LPVVSKRIVESDFKLRPRTVEEVGSVHILLNQKWDAASCQSNEHQQLGLVKLSAVIHVPDNVKSISQHRCSNHSRHL